MNLAGKEEGLKDVMDRVEADILATGGKIESVQKMDKKPFARVTDRRLQGGHYVNYVFEASPKAAASLGEKFRHADDIYRYFFSAAPKPVVKK